MRDTFKTLLAAFNLMVALAWILLVLFIIVSSYESISSLGSVVYWACLLVGPALLFVGSLAFIRNNRRPRRVSFLAVAGALALWFLAAVDLPGAREALALDARGLTSWWVAFVRACLLTYFAAGFLYWDVPSSGEARRVQ
jgi:hypothetical protein